LPKATYFFLENLVAAYTIAPATAIKPAKSKKLLPGKSIKNFIMLKWIMVKEIIDYFFLVH
jgi:hypothetical protein